jgi:signal transduction histidine kinase
LPARPDRAACETISLVPAVQELNSDQLQRLLEVGRGLVSRLEPEVVLEHLLEAARELTAARYAALGVLDPEKRQLERFVFRGIDEATRQEIGPLPDGHGILGELIRDPRTLRLARISDHPRSYGFPAGHPPMTSFLGCPVMIRGEVYGNLYLTDKTSAPEFDQGDEQLLEILAEWAAVAIANARSHQDLKRRGAELERAVLGLQATADLNREVEHEPDLERALELIVKRGRALVDARVCLALLVDEGQLQVASAAGEIEDTVPGTRFEAGGPALEVMQAGVPQRVQGRALEAFGSLGFPAEGALLIPLRSRGVGFGVLAAFDRIGDEPAFTADDELVLASFAGAAAGAIASITALEGEKLRLSIAASEGERRRWARELHDETLQELGALKVAQQTALRAEDPTAVRAAVEASAGQIERLIDGLESLITELRPAALDQLGIQAAVEALVERVSARHGLEISADFDLAFEGGREASRPTPELEATIYRLVQEALSNVVKHADATHVKIVIDERDESFGVIVEDDGRGFGEPIEGGGFGLVGMRERVALVDGEIVIGPGPSGGTRVMAALPATRRGS